jgi:hypothetical protein
LCNAKVPGDFESMNQMVAGTPGLISSSSGNVTKSKRHHTCATVWCDHVSRFLWSHLQESTNAVTTLQSKVEFEAFAPHYGHSIKHIHSDNQIFDSKAFTKAVELANQSQSFCGIGAHWQNGVIERHIGIITAHARTMLLHAMSMWPNLVTPDF